MKKTLITSLSIIVFAGGFLALFLSGPKEQKAPVVNQPEEQTAVKQNWETKTEEQASVTVVITPLDLSPNSKEWKFDVVMDTHSVELDQDMTKIAVLVDDQGKEYVPLRWEGAEAGGHHREGVLIFNQVTPTSKSVELKVSGIGGVIRKFTWQLK